MKKVKKTLHNMFIAVGFGTMVYVPMLLLNKGLNDTMQSVLTWVFASVLYGLSFEIIKIKSKIKYPIHIAVCFIITIATRLVYSYIENGTVDVIKTVIITIPIFVGVYIALYLFMKYIGNVKEEK
ncbi:MAG: DUF3021 family protein [Candidatus Pseudoruminococcus sp.]|nr:DUF3021 family protein [Ruminococcus sp.]MDY2782372.1 DUF3021 family protein [Candidatus Pseudoruminococcus sp.]